MRSAKRHLVGVSGDRAYHNWFLLGNMHKCRMGFQGIDKEVATLMNTWIAICNHCGEIACARLRNPQPIAAVANRHEHSYVGHYVRVTNLA